jgi:carboxyl-terminal processing protease
LKSEDDKESSGSSAYVPKDREKDIQLNFALDFVRGLKTDYKQDKKADTGQDKKAAAN